MSKRTCENETALLLMGRKTFTGALQGVKDGSVNIDCEDGKYTTLNSAGKAGARPSHVARAALWSVSKKTCENEASH